MLRLNRSKPDVLFIGTSLSVNEACRRVPPGTLVLPPVRRGDIDRITSMLEGPGNILIVDGYFFSTQAVSLTEIRGALRKGWRVVGASSMGALRAIEAASVGMQGFGRVHRWLRLFRVEDDDEVAQVVDPETGASIGPAMVDIRSFAAHLVRRRGLSSAIAKEAVASIKTEFFPTRRYAQFSAYLERRGFGAEAAVAREECAGFKGVKTRDAEELVEALAAFRKAIV